MTVLTIQPNEASSKDGYISNAVNLSYNYGISNVVAILTTGTTKERGLIQFDFSSIPVGSVITSAILTLEAVGVGSSTAATISVHRALTDWYEGDKDGATPSIPGSSWNRRDQFNATDWGSATPGGLSGTDYSAAAATSTSVGATGDYTWDLTSEVNAMINSGVTNRGWWLISNSTVYKNFRSSHDTGNPSKWPKLVITYTSSEQLIGAIAGTSTVTGTLSTVTPSVSIAATEDTYLLSSSASANYGVFISLSVSGGAAVRKTLIKFDLSSIPAGSSILAAALTMRCIQEDSASVNTTVSAHRSLVQWYEGDSNGTTPGAGVNASTYNHRNHNGSINWAGGVGGAAGSDYASSPTDDVVISDLGYHIWDVAADVQAVVNGTVTNHGWWFVTDSVDASGRKYFASAENATVADRPTLLVVYQAGMFATVNGTSTVTGTLEATGNMRGSAAGTSSHHVQLISNFFSVGSTDGTSTVTGRLSAFGKLQGNSFGDSTVAAGITANYKLHATAAGTSFHVAHIKGVFRMQGLAAGVGGGIARISSEGTLRGSAEGTSTATATGYPRAINVAAVIGCNPVPLLHITNGSVKPNGQLNILDFLGDRAGYFLINYRPQISQYKDNGYWSSSPQSQGRRLKGKVFDNVVDVIEVAAKAGSQDALIQYQQDLIDFQEAASDYWASDYAFLPYYLVARAARETNIRYSLIHMISCPQLENPYTQPFFDDAVGAVFANLTIRIEHGLWMSTPPGKFDCVEVSGQREWTVSGWQTGS